MRRASRDALEACESEHVPCGDPASVLELFELAADGSIGRSHDGSVHGSEEYSDGTGDDLKRDEEEREFRSWLGRLQGLGDVRCGPC